MSSSNFVEALSKIKGHAINGQFIGAYNEYLDLQKQMRNSLSETGSRTKIYVGFSNKEKTFGESEILDKKSSNAYAAYQVLEEAGKCVAEAFKGEFYSQALDIDLKNLENIDLMIEGTNTIGNTLKNALKLYKENNEEAYLRVAKTKLDEFYSESTKAIEDIKHLEQNYDVLIGVIKKELNQFTKYFSDKIEGDLQRKAYNNMVDEITKVVYSLPLSDSGKRALEKTFKNRENFQYLTALDML